MFGMIDIVLVLVVLAVILLFGAPKLVDWAKALGDAKKAFTDASDGKKKEKKVKKK